MKLADYMAKAKISDEALGKLVGRDRSTVSRWRRDQKRPDWEAMARLEAVTNRRVTARDFVPEISAIQAAE